MGDRRQFVKSIAEAGAVFAGCCLTTGSLRAQSAARRREVVVGGRLTDAERRAILGETAAKLLRIA